MTPQELIAEAHRHGATLTVLDSQLKATPKGILPPTLKALIHEHAAEIKAYLDPHDLALTHDETPLATLHRTALPEAPPRTPAIA